jgi:hypothetical protein
MSVVDSDRFRKDDEEAVLSCTSWTGAHEHDRCARTVHESNFFIPFGLLLSEEQIPRFVGNVSS